MYPNEFYIVETESQIKAKFEAIKELIPSHEIDLFDKLEAGAEDFAKGYCDGMAYFWSSYRTIFGDDQLFRSHTGSQSYAGPAYEYSQKLVTDLQESFVLLVAKRHKFDAVKPKLTIDEVKLVDLLQTGQDDYFNNKSNKGAPSNEGMKKFWEHFEAVFPNEKKSWIYKNFTSKSYGFEDNCFIYSVKIKDYLENILIKKYIPAPLTIFIPNDYRRNFTTNLYNFQNTNPDNLIE